jgi:transcriptional regulator with XRE-family HTH domain
MAEVAERAGLTAGFISQLERDLTSASLSSLYRICAVLGIRVGNLVDDVPSGRLIRREEQARRSLAMGDAELVYVLRGSLELRVGEETHVLDEGDTFSYSPLDPHTWRNPSQTDEAVVLWTALPNPYAV